MASHAKCEVHGQCNGAGNIWSIVRNDSFDMDLAMKLDIGSAIK